ncbi:hypothetical protein CANARDRAFT_204882 [[Candida] arabinofermentans NRRL YB-2248]|uniref:Peptide hydrolase n=1 Tax=[Candida] arabinofermentans NRRL YB-2248 TaxID=983967 RepID=A0A1E4SSV6_9ASCO|nr:hypothetical protein CANARDRAFT_204882 [[Candida] arabinofermentans NRRL YB-2248]
MTQDKPGFFTRFVRSTFGFRKTTLTFLVVISYILAIAINLYFDHLSLTPPNPNPKILTRSWIDLQQISTDFHPYDSHANDQVHDYLLLRLDEISTKKPYFNYTDDYNNLNIMINQQDVFDPSNLANRIIYFESSNLVFKIQGKDPNLEGVLISAHYDSVPTAYGTTDDGMGIASMLGVLEHFAKSTTDQPDRTLIFNFNNNEEFGLLGAEAFLKHEWYPLVKYFINLEGTGAGGKAVLFRSTDVGILSYYSGVERPFGNSLMQQGFQSGLIRSQTDYKVYTENGLRGVDIAFYKPRSLYHTLRDSISSTTKGSLWHMEKNCLDMVSNLAYNIDPIDDNLQKAIFFDILGWYLIYLPVDSLYKLNVFILTIVPTITLIFLIIVNKRGTWHVDAAKGWLRLPISLTCSYFVTNFVSSYIYLNDPLLLSNDYISPLLALSSLNILCNYFILNFASWLRPVHDQKLIVLFELNIITWCLTCWATTKEKIDSNVGCYSFTIIYLLVSIASLFGLLSLMLKPKAPRYKKVMKPRLYGSTDEEQQQHLIDQNSIQSSSNTTTVESDHHPLMSDTASTTSRTNSPTIVIIDHETEETYKKKLKDAALKSFSYDWSLQFLMMVPLSILIIFTDGELLLQALHQTVQESKILGNFTMKMLVYIAICLGCPILPFVHKLNSIMLLFFMLVMLICCTISYFEEPYSFSAPLKLRFLQTVTSGSDDDDKAIVSLFGRSGYIKPILKDIPSVDEKDVNCTQYKESGNELCLFNSKRPWLIDGTISQNDYSNYLNIEIITNSNTDKKKKSDKYSPFNAELKINVEDNRNCVLNFNSSKYNYLDSKNNKKMISPVKLITIYNSEIDSTISPNPIDELPTGYSIDLNGNHHFKLMKGIDELQLHKLNWTQNSYHLGIQWLPFTFEDDDFKLDDLSNNLGINVKCYWGEYDDKVNVDDDEVDDEVDEFGFKIRKVPALDELIQYSPDYIIYSNLAKGLVEVDGYVEL